MKKDMSNFCHLSFLYLALITVTSCTHYFYYPEKKTLLDPKKHYQADYEDIFLTTKDGEKLHGLFLKRKKDLSRGVVLYFHGNADNVSGHFPQVLWLTEFGYDVLAADYRGYGKSSGDPHPDGLIEDARTWVTKAQELAAGKRIIVMGESLGGAVAGYASCKFPEKIQLLVLKATFPSYVRLAREKLQETLLTSLLSPLTPLLINDSRSLEKCMKNYAGEVLVIHDKKDPVVPYHFGKEVYDMIEKGPKRFWTTETGLHMVPFQEKYGLAPEKLVHYMQSGIN